MPELYLFLFLLLIIFLLHNKFSQSFFGLWYLVTRSKKWAVNLTALFLFLGTLIHEMSHFLVATFLGVATGEFNLWPKFEEGKGIRMGSVAIAKCDFVRRSLIGLAPVFSGITIIYILSLVLPSNLKFLINEKWWLNLIIILVIFIISNTMFSSNRDMAEIVPFIVLLLIIWGFVNFMGWKMGGNFSYQLKMILSKINQALILVVGINLIILTGVRIMMIGMEKVLKRRIITSTR